MNFNHVQREDNRHQEHRSWWKKRTVMEKRLVVVTAITTAAMLALLVTLLVVHSDSTGTCLTSGCVAASADVVSYADELADPCNDFYQFACGSFLKDDDSIESDQAMSTGRSMDIILLNHIRDMLDEPIRPDDDFALEKAKTFYHSCINDTGVDTQGVKHLKEALKDIGGWPMLDVNWKEGDFDWKRTTQKLRRVGYTFDLFLSIVVGVSREDESKHIIEVMAPGSHQLEVSDRFRDLHQGYVVDIGTLLGAARSRAERDAKDILEFQEGLRKVAQRSEERNGHNNSYNPRTVSKLHYEFPSVPWFDYINGILRPRANISADEVIVVPDTVYIKELLNLLNKAPKRVLANFMGWRFIEDFLQYLPKEYSEIKRVHYERTMRNKMLPKWMQCFDDVEQVLPFHLKDIYATKYYSQETRRSISAMVNLIRRKFDKQIENFEWLDADGRSAAKVKIASLVQKVADYSDFAHDGEWVDLVYDKVDIHENKFLLSLLELRRLRTSFEYKKLRQKVQPHQDILDMYDMKTNKLTIPVDYLHGIYYGAARPNYMNFGALGSLIARDLSNMFLEGQFIDVYGNLREWYITDNLYVYNNKTNCFANQNTRFYVPEIRRSVNNSMSSKTDVAEVAGLKYAYRAYSSWIDSNGFEAGLPGVRHTTKQLFWISAAMARCSKYDGESTEGILLRNKVTLDRLKVNYALRNLKEFAEAFSCPVGSKMNPEEKCEMW